MCSQSISSCLEAPRGAKLPVMKLEQILSKGWESYLGKGTEADKGPHGADPQPTQRAGLQEVFM